LGLVDAATAEEEKYDTQTFTTCINRIGLLLSWLLLVHRRRLANPLHSVILDFQANFHNISSARLRARTASSANPLDLRRSSWSWYCTVADDDSTILAPERTTGGKTYTVHINFNRKQAALLKNHLS